MTDNEITTITEINAGNLEKIAALIGQTGLGKPTNVGLPRLAIEQMADNDDGERLPKGEFRIRSGDQNIYIKTPEVRLYARYFSYGAYNTENPKDSIQTVMKPSLKEEFPDSKGGLKCGKLTKEEVEALPKNSSKLALQKSIKCCQVVYGYIEKGKGTTISGEEHNLKGTPFVWSVRGSAFEPVWNYVSKLGHKNIMFSRLVKLSTKRNTMGSVTYYTPNLDEVGSVKLTDEDVKRLNLFMEDIQSYNTRIISSYKDHQKDKLTEDELEVGDSLEVA